MKQKTIKYLLSLYLFFFSILSFPQSAKANVKTDEFYVLFWNLENLFDYMDEGKSDADKEFSPFGAKRWGRRKFYAKCNAIAKTLMWISEEYGKLPDIMGFAEVENAFVLKSLLKQPSLKRTNYAIVHYESQDLRGIDVALLYNKDVFEYQYSGIYPIVIEGDTLKTRDILLVTLRQKGGPRYNFIVNHHPSKYSGAQQTQYKREAAMRTLSKIAQNLLKYFKSEKSTNENIIAMGDFNDSPDQAPLGFIDGVLYSNTQKFRGQDVGTIRHQGKWELIDYFLTSKSLKERVEMFILNPPFLLEWDNAHSGFKPKRTYSGPRYRGGVSDHLPILLQVF